MSKRFKIVHSEDAMTVLVEGDRRNPEPSTVVVKFPGGHIELARCSDDTYWAHLQVVDGSNIVASRIDYQHGATVSVAALPDGALAQKVALRVANNVPHFDPDR